MFIPNGHLWTFGDFGVECCPLTRLVDTAAGPLGEDILEEEDLVG